MAAARASSKNIVDASRLNGAEKCAVILLALGEEHASVWQALDEEEIKEISQAMASLGNVSAVVVEDRDAGPALVRRFQPGGEATRTPRRGRPGAVEFHQPSAGAGQPDQQPLGLFGRADLAKDAGVEDKPTGFAAITLAYNARSKEEADEIYALAVKAGARPVKPLQDVFWGGYSGYFSDPDGHLWEVAHNPFFPLDETGHARLS